MLGSGSQHRLEKIIVGSFWLTTEAAAGTCSWGDVPKSAQKDIIEGLGSKAERMVRVMSRVQACMPSR